MFYYGFTEKKGVNVRQAARERGKEREAVTI